MNVDQAAINAGFDFRRYAMKPMPAKPRIIIALLIDGRDQDLRLKTTLPNEYVIGIVSLVIRNVRYLVPGPNSDAPNNGKK